MADPRIPVEVQPGHHDWENERGHTKVTPAERESMREELLRLDALDAENERKAKRRRIDREAFGATGFDLLKAIGLEQYKPEAGAPEWIDYHEDGACCWWLLAAPQPCVLLEAAAAAHPVGGRRCRSTLRVVGDRRCRSPRPRPPRRHGRRAQGGAGGPPPEARRAP